MSLRSFVDSAGNEWQAFDVVPRSDERRHTERRSSGEVPVDSIERREADRRLTVGGAAVITGARGWLCFERGNDRRRLSPIPEDWNRCDDSQLEVYRQSARPVRRNSVSLRELQER
jgi:hypothetical protein